MQSEEITHNLKDVNQWMRIVYMVLFTVLFNASAFILGLVAVIQAIFALITGRPNGNIRELAAGVSQYIHEIARFLSYSTEEKPFPFKSWPEVELEDLPEPSPSYTAPAAEETVAEYDEVQETESVEEGGSEDKEPETEVPDKT